MTRRRKLNPADPNCPACGGRGFTFPDRSSARICRCRMTVAAKKAHAKRSAADRLEDLADALEANE